MPFLEGFLATVTEGVLSPAMPPDLAALRLVRQVKLATVKLDDECAVLAAALSPEGPRGECDVLGRSEQWRRHSSLKLAAESASRTPKAERRGAGAFQDVSGFSSVLSGVSTRCKMCPGHFN